MFNHIPAPGFMPGAFYFKTWYNVSVNNDSYGKKEGIGPFFLVIISIVFSAMGLLGGNLIQGECRYTGFNEGSCFSEGISFFALKFIILLSLISAIIAICNVKKAKNETALISGTIVAFILGIVAFIVSI